MVKASRADRRRYWQTVIDRQQASGQDIVGFCFTDGLAPAPFHAWTRRLRPSPLATRLPLKPSCLTAGWPPILSTGLNSGKKNPVKPKPVAAGNELLVGLPS
jgi:hypothetical protein